MGPTDYVLLELLNRLGGVQGRKKLQKLVYIAKLDGVPLEDDFFFHHYGPYSCGLAARVDQLVETGLLTENTRHLSIADGVEYGYQLTEKARSFLNDVQKEVPPTLQRSLDSGFPPTIALKDRDVFQLELAATLLYWLEKGHPWEEAEGITQQRKNADLNSTAFKEAKLIAKDIWETRKSSEC